MIKNKKNKKVEIEKPIYVSVVACGEWDENVTKVEYVGRNLSAAKRRIENYKYPNPNNNFGWIEHWIGGKNIKDEQVYV